MVTVIRMTMMTMMMMMRMMTGWCKHLDSPPLPLEDLAKVARTGESKQATS